MPRTVATILVVAFMSLISPARANNTISSHLRLPTVRGKRVKRQPRYHLGSVTRARFGGHASAMNGFLRLRSLIDALDANVVGRKQEKEALVSKLLTLLTRIDRELARGGQLGTVTLSLFSKPGEAQDAAVECPKVRVRGTRTHPVHWRQRRNGSGEYIVWRGSR